jgi:hypothetical protein
MVSTDHDQPWALLLPPGLISDLEARLRQVVREEIDRAIESRSPWFDVPGAAAYAASTEDSIRSAEKRGQLRGYRGETGRLRFHVDDLDAFLRGVTPNV